MDKASSIILTTDEDGATVTITESGISEAVVINRRFAHEAINAANLWITGHEYKLVK